MIKIITPWSDKFTVSQETVAWVWYYWFSTNLSASQISDVLLEQHNIEIDSVNLVLVVSAFTNTTVKWEYC